MNDIFERIRQRKEQMVADMFKVGDIIRINHLKGEDTRYDGKEGTITFIDGIGQLHGTWGGLAVIPQEDSFTIIKKA